MTLENIYYIGQTVTVIVIIASLIAIFLQSKQTNKIARADLTLSMWMQTGQMQYALFDSPEKAEFMQRSMYDSAPLSDAEKLRFNNAIAVGIGVHEAAFNLRARNLVEHAAYERNAAATRDYLKSRRVRKWWKLHRGHGFASEFCEIIDAIVAEYEAGDKERQEPFA